MREDKYYIIGGGWYGCFVANFFERHDIPYILIEAEEDLFLGASGFNQNRLHLGYHYPRNQATRLECMNGFDWFLKEFPSLVSDVENNIYAIHKNSLLDYGTYKSIYEHEGYEFKEANPKFLLGITHCISVKEKFIDPSKAAQYWRSKGLQINFNSKAQVVNDTLFVNGGQVSDAIGVIDCTWGNMSGNQYGEAEYFVSFVLKPKTKNDDFGALTVMDGEFFSIYPYINGLFTLTHVKHGIAGTRRLTSLQIDRIKKDTIRDVKTVYPSFDHFFEIDSYFLSRKFKRKSTTADRSVKFIQHSSLKNSFQILSGKIDSLYLVQDHLEDNLL